MSLPISRPLRRALPLAAVAWLGLSGSVQGWELGGPLYAPRWDAAPSLFGYNLDETGPGYYGGGRYREFYSFGRGYGVANFPGPLPLDRFGVRPWRHRPLTPHSPVPPAPPVGTGVAHLLVRVPEGAQLWVEGRPSVQTGVARFFVTPPLYTGVRYVLQLRARWQAEQGPREESKEVVVRAGDRLEVTFAADEGTPSLPTPRPFPLNVDP